MKNKKLLVGYLEKLQEIYSVLKLHYAGHRFFLDVTEEVRLLIEKIEKDIENEKK